jgi:hypothetical protein
MAKRRRRSVLAVVLAVTVAAVSYAGVRLISDLPSLLHPARQTGYTGSVLIGTDDRTLILSGFEPGGFTCGDGVMATVAESSRTVALGIEYTQRDPSRINPDCATADGITTAVAHLSRPLGNRTLVDRKTGATLGSFDESRLLHPHVPAGYVLFSTSPYDAGPGIGGAIQRWQSMKEGEGGEYLTLTQISGSLATVSHGYPVPHQSSPPLLVRGHPATEFADSGAVAWTENGEALLMHWQTRDPQPTTASVIAIADSSP